MFEFEERYKVTDTGEICGRLERVGFTLVGTDSQVDHWFIPSTIMSPEAQGNWFDNEWGIALRIREESGVSGTKILATAKQVVEPGNHNNMTTLEELLTVAGLRRVFAFMGSEFTPAMQLMNDRKPEDPLSYADAKTMIESAGRKEYITLEKDRKIFRNPIMPDVVADLDSIPALAGTRLGFSASLELEYVGAGTEVQAAEVIRTLGARLGYERADILEKALPGMAIPYLARF